MMTKDKPETLLKKDYNINPNYYRVVKWLTKRHIDFKVSNTKSKESKTRSIYIPLFRVKGGLIWDIRISDHEYKHFAETPYNITLDYSDKINLKVLKQEIKRLAIKADKQRQIAEGDTLKPVEKKVLVKQMHTLEAQIRTLIGQPNLLKHLRTTAYTYGTLQERIKILKGLKHSYGKKNI